MEINRIINFYDQGVEIPSQLKTALLHLFDVDNIDNFFSKNIRLWNSSPYLSR